MKNPKVSELNQKIDEFIAYCEATGEPPVAHVVKERLGLSEDMLSRLRRGEGGESLRQAAQRFEDYREYFWIKKGLKDSKLATFATFNLKELRESDAGEVRITVRTEGVGPEAFR